MRNPDHWQPTKFVFKQGRLMGSRDPQKLWVASRLNADLIAELYNQYLKEHCTGHLLDLGCGEVPLYAVYKNYITEHTCADWENTFHKNLHIDVECDLTKPLPFENNQFDTILLSDVLEHIPNPEHLWQEMFRILKTGGKLLMNVPFYYWLHEEPHDYYRYTQYALRRFAESTGFTILLLEPIGGGIEILADIIAKNVVDIPKVGPILSIGIQAITYKLIKTAWGTKVSKNTATHFPFGYFLIGEKRS